MAIYLISWLARPGPLERAFHRRFHPFAFSFDARYCAASGDSISPKIKFVNSAAAIILSFSAISAYTGAPEASSQSEQASVSPLSVSEKSARSVSTSPSVSAPELSRYTFGKFCSTSGTQESAETRGESVPTSSTRPSNVSVSLSPSSTAPTPVSSSGASTAARVSPFECSSESV